MDSPRIFSLFSLFFVFFLSFFCPLHMCAGVCVCVCVLWGVCARAPQGPAALALALAWMSGYKAPPTKRCVYIYFVI